MAVCLEVSIIARVNNLYIEEEYPTLDYLCGNA